jgi:hypothetical protein
MEGRAGLPFILVPFDEIRAARASGMLLFFHIPFLEPGGHKQADAETRRY